MRWMAVIALMVLISSAQADVRVLGFGAQTAWEDFDVVAGVCSYQELDDFRADRDNGQNAAAYVQVPAAVWDNARLNVGVVCPFFDARRARPEFSVSYLWGKVLGLPEWCPMETGVYYGMSPWQPWGVQLGVVRYGF